MYKGGVKFIISGLFFPVQVKKTDSISIAKPQKIESMLLHRDDTDGVICTSYASSYGEKMTRNSTNSRHEKCFKSLDKVLKERRHKLKKNRAKR